MITWKIGDRFVYDGIWKYILVGSKTHINLMNSNNEFWTDRYVQVMDSRSIRLHELENLFLTLKDNFTGPNYPPVQNTVLKLSKTTVTILPNKDVEIRGLNGPDSRPVTYTFNSTQVGTFLNRWANQNYLRLGHILLKTSGFSIDNVEFFTYEDMEKFTEVWKGIKV